MWECPTDGFRNALNNRVVSHQIGVLPQENSSRLEEYRLVNSVLRHGPGN